MNKKTAALSAREKRFCASFAECGSAQEAARAAGFEAYPKRAGERLLSDPRVVKEISRLSDLRRELLGKLAYTGYMRLAFGGVSDAVKLLFADRPTDEQIAQMDLFSVSEIRRPKDGSMEIKFTDRLKALEKLEQALSEADGTAAPFYEALRLASQAVSGSGSGSSSGSGSGYVEGNGERLEI